jgi:hypothetical protein
MHRWQGHATEWYTSCIVSGETAAWPLFSVHRYEIRHTSLIGHLKVPVRPYDKGMWNSSWMNSRGPSLLVVPRSLRTPTENKIRGNTHRRTSETWRGRGKSPPPNTSRVGRRLAPCRTNAGSSKRKETNSPHVLKQFWCAMWEDEFIMVHTEKTMCWTVIFHVIEVSFACPRTKAYTKEYTLFQVVTMESGSETF